MTDKQCFVCDFNVSGKYHALSSYSFKTSKKLLVEKLASMLSDRMILICRPSDVICQACVDSMEMVERLETMTKASKRVIHKFLDKKYGQGGSLIKTEDDATNRTDLPIKFEREEEDVETNTPLSFAERKKQSKANVEGLTEEIENDPRSKILLECNKCHYTLNYTEFEKRHLTKNTPKSDTLIVNNDSESLHLHNLNGIVEEQFEELECNLNSVDEFENDEEYSDVINYEIIEIPTDAVTEVLTYDNDMNYDNVQVVWQDSGSIEEDNIC